MEIELHQLDLRYAGLRVADRPEDSRLVASLVRAGQQSPVLVVRGDQEGAYRLVDGFRRVRALRALARDTVEALVLDLDDAEALLLCYRARARDRLTAIEEAWLLRELVETHGLGQAELALRLERSESWVSRRLALVRELPESVQERVRLGRLCPQAAMRYLVPLARAKPAECERLVERLGSQRPSVRQMAALYAAWKSARPAARARIVEEPLLYLKTEREVSRPAPAEAGPVEADRLVADLELVAQLCFRLRRRLREVTRSAGAGLPLTLEELWKQTRAAFESLDRVLAEALHARP
jgi:ParB family chromosome partitioning protein